MRLEQPPGVRSCRDGGTWDLAQTNTDPARGYVTVELTQLKSVMPPGEYTLLTAEIVRMMEDAQAGDLDFVTNTGGRRVGDVDQMAVAPTVLELRLQTTTGTRDGERIVRLYFTEPAELPDALVALKLASKYPGELGLEEQSAHAREAAVRGDDYVAGRTSGMS